MKDRYLRAYTAQDLPQRMVFVGGPRQVGKTTFALNFLDPPSKANPSYYNWDIVRRRHPLLQAQFPAGAKLIVIDEIHKYSKWRNLLKGYYDEFFPERSFLITGSARLDYYRRGGDSLLGRYHYQRLHPLSPMELHSAPNLSDVSALLKFGGFPEPFLNGTERFLRRWHLERGRRILREDLRDLENVRDISLLELLLEALPARVGSPLSVKNLQEDLQCAHESVERWISIFENLYLVYRIAPYGPPKLKAMKKEKKLYFWDWSVVESPGARFENFIGSLLLKYCHFLEDTQGYHMDLRYFRDKEKREVDFIVLKDKKPTFAVECKTGERSISKHLQYLIERASIPKSYQVHLGVQDYETGDKRIRVLPCIQFCRELGIP